MLKVECDDLHHTVQLGALGRLEPQGYLEGCEDMGVCLWQHFFNVLRCSPSLISNIPDPFNVHEKRVGAWDLMSHDKHYLNIGATTCKRGSR